MFFYVKVCKNLFLKKRYQFFILINRYKLVNKKIYNVMIDLYKCLLLIKVFLLGGLNEYLKCNKRRLIEKRQY